MGQHGQHLLLLHSNSYDAYIAGSKDNWGVFFPLNGWKSFDIQMCNWCLSNYFIWLDWDSLIECFWNVATNSLKLTITIFSKYCTYLLVSCRLPKKAALYKNRARQSRIVLTSRHTVT